MKQSSSWGVRESPPPQKRALIYPFGSLPLKGEGRRKKRRIRKRRIRKRRRKSGKRKVA